MPELVFSKATDADIDHVARHLRPEHVREVEEQSGLAADVAVELSADTSRLVMAGRVEGVPVCLIGVSKTLMLSDVGSVWMVATPDIDRHPLEAAAALRELFGHAHDLAGARVLEQYIPPWYLKGVKWLLWLGWKAAGNVTLRGKTFIHMTHERE